METTMRTRIGPLARRALAGAALAALLAAAALPALPAVAAPCDRGDADGDGMSNLAECNFGTDPDRADSDWDGTLDPDEVHRHNTDPLNPDTDGDGLSDTYELGTGTDPLDDGFVDRQPPAPEPAPAPEGRPDGDGDGLYDDDEWDVYFTDPTLFDTDGDGAGDGEEVHYGTDPLNAEG